jgi:hypothetical protein
VNESSSTIAMNDSRLLARILNLAHRFGCGYTKLEAEYDGSRYVATLNLTGDADALRRLDAQIAKLLDDDKELFS